MKVTLLSTLLWKPQLKSVYKQKLVAGNSKKEMQKPIYPKINQTLPTSYNTYLSQNKSKTLSTSYTIPFLPCTTNNNHILPKKPNFKSKISV